jgi:hypothetical protein
MDYLPLDEPCCSPRARVRCHVDFISCGGLHAEYVGYRFEKVAFVVPGNLPDCCGTVL